VADRAIVDDLVVSVRDLVGSPDKQCPVSGRRTVALRLGETTVDGPMTVTGTVSGLQDAVRAVFHAEAIAHMSCTRCTTEWDEDVEADGEQFFGRSPDEDGYMIVDGAVDVGKPAQDELALALPAAPVCRDDCLGLCPTCGTDLNTDPCDGHGEESSSPFSVLKDLFDS
jgi:uncharacterized protein